MTQRNRSHKPNKEGTRFCTQYRHWRTGKLMIAKDYGYQAWPFGRRKN